MNYRFEPVEQVSLMETGVIQETMINIKYLNS